MNKDELLKTSSCIYNYLWECDHKDQRGKECTGPCKLFDNGKIICPLCYNPVELDYCINVKCNYHV